MLFLVGLLLAEVCGFRPKCELVLEESSVVSDSIVCWNVLI